MGWARLDDKRADNEKLMTAGLEARGLDEAAICWCAGHETDGFIPTTAVAMLAAGHGSKNPKRITAKLVEVGRWDVVDGGWQIHDYLEYNASRKELEAKREEERERKARQRANGSRNSGRGANGQFSPNGIPPGVPPGQPPGRDSESQGVSSATRLRPVPSTSPPKPPRDMADAETGTKPPPAHRDWDRITRLVALTCTGKARNYVQTEAGNVAAWALQHVDPTVIEESVGWATSDGRRPPTLPRAIAVVIRSKAADRGVQMPEFTP